MKSKLAFKRNQKKILNYALWLIGRRARTQREIEEKLSRKGFDKSEILKTVDKLKQLRLLDDKEYSLSYIKASKSLKPKGRYRLLLELTKHGVDKGTAQLALDEELEDTGTLAETALKSYLKRSGGLSKEKLYQRSMGFLLRRGFSLDEAKKAVKKVLTSASSSDNFDL
ncbi:MAG: recombination regulator RecX [Candidatus Berkelbacteria bacterium]|nr:recombination regulator RecX [Candidatus Berkelbacteria bacterium]